MYKIYLISYVLIDVNCFKFLIHYFRKEIPNVKQPAFSIISSRGGLFFRFDDYRVINWLYTIYNFLL